MNTSLRRSLGALVASLAIVGPIAAAVVSAAPAGADLPTLVINEVESNGGTPGDWVELKNTGPSDLDISGYVVKDNDDTHVFTIPASTTIAAGGYYVADVDPLFGLGSADSARLFTPGAASLVDSYSWTAHAATTYGRCPNGTGAFTTTTSSTKGAANDCGVVLPSVKINEVESSGGSPGDWVELVNNGTTPADISSYVVKDNDDTHVFTIPASTVVPAGGYYVADVDPVFGLGSADSARLFTPGAATLVDSYSWTAHAVVTYGRCPNSTGSFADTQASTRGAANICPGDIVAQPWPGGTSVSVADDVNVFGTNLSGLAYQPSGTSAPGVLWAVRNGPSTLYRLVYDGTKWTPDTANGWGAGKQLRYPDGTGDPDAEGVSLVGNDPVNGVYVSTERNNSANTISRPEVLRFDVSGATAELNATTEWNLTSDLPPLGANLGLEAVAWIPDSFLVAKGFLDEHTGAPYTPGTYADHGTGLFFVGAEQNGAIYAYALGQTGTFTKVATIASGFPSVMDLELEPESGHLWAECDNTCTGRAATLDIASTGPNVGRFVVTNFYERPAGMPDINNEGFAIAPRQECSGGLKPAFWSDDSNTDSHALRVGTISCTDLAAQTITFAKPAPITFRDAPAPLVATASSGLPVAFSATGPCAVTGTPDAPTLTATGAGRCVITASQPGDDDTAAAVDVSRAIVIQRSEQTITFTPPTALTLGDAPIPQVATASSGLPVTFTASGPCSVTGTPEAPTLTVSDVGKCLVTANQPGDANTRPAHSVSRTIKVNPAPTTLTQSSVGEALPGGTVVIHYSAVLTSSVTGEPLAGQLVSFRASGSGAAACSATTDAAGTAACDSPAVPAKNTLLNGTTIARFAGTASYLAATSTTPLVVH